MSRASILSRPSPRSSRGRKPLEKDVLRACLDLLRAKKIWCERRNSGVMESATGKGRWVKFGEKGMADIFALPKAHENVVDATLCAFPTWIECKRPGGGKQSYEQKLFQHIVEAEGHAYLLVDDVQQLADWLSERGL